MGRITELSISEFCSFMWYLIAQGHEDDASLQQTKAKLWQPPKGVEVKQGPWAQEAQKQGFDQLKAQLGL